MSDILVSLLSRHPWSERRMIEALFEPAALREELKTAKITTLRTAGGQERWARANESTYTLLRLSRIDPARIYLLRGFGPHALWQGQSPAEHADAEGFHRGRRILVFVDPDNIALEALDFLLEPPADEGASRVVLSPTPERRRLIGRWIERSWRGGGVIVDDAPSIRSWSDVSRVSFSPQTVRPRHAGRRIFLSEDVHDRQRPQVTKGETRERNQLGKAWIQNGPNLQRRLVLAGNCPLFTLSEWMHIERDFERRSRKEWKALIALGLLKSESDGSYDRWMLSGLGLLALCSLWKVEPDVLRRYHPWPTRLRGRLEYSSRWKKFFGVHADLVRQASLSFADTGQRFSSVRTASVLSAVLFGSRYRYLYYSDSGQGKTNFIAPDATMSIGLGNREAAAAPQMRYTLLLEIDRATHPLTRLAARLDRYGLLWKKDESFGPRPVLFWITDGEGRERFLEEEMRRRGIDGRACTFDRLRLRKDDDWWLRHPLLGSELPFDSLGGLCTWRPVWLTTASRGRVMPLDIE